MMKKIRTLIHLMDGHNQLKLKTKGIENWTFSNPDMEKI